MIIANPDEQVWNMLTGGAGCSAGRQEIDKLKRMRFLFFFFDKLTAIRHACSSVFHYS